MNILNLLNAQIEKMISDFYAARGPLTVDSEMPPITSAWFQSAKELGYNVCDPNGNQIEGMDNWRDNRFSIKFKQ